MSENESDDACINKAISLANGTPVLLEAKTYTLKDSIKFKSGYTGRQTLICPGTLLISPNLLSHDIPAIDINTREVSLKINKIEGTPSLIVSFPNVRNYNGVGIRFSVYTENSDIEVNTLTNLNKGFCVQPDTWDDGSGTEKPEYGGIQGCSIKFGTVSADYCFYIDVFSKAQYINKATGQPVNLKNATDLSQMTLTPRNWFNNNQITGKLMKGQYGIYVVGPNEFNVNNRDAGSGYSNTIDPEKVSNVLTGLKFSNISFEGITALPVRLRSVARSTFLNLRMYYDLPGNNLEIVNDTTPWIDLDNINEVRMTFNSYLLPSHIYVGESCKNTYINGAIIYMPDRTKSQFDTLGIDTLYHGKDSGSQEIFKSSKFVTSSVVPFNMAKNFDTASNPSSYISKYIKDLLPIINEGTSDPEQLILPVLPTTLNVDIQSGKTLYLYLSGLDTFAPCLYTVNANIAGGGKLCFRTSDSLLIEGDTPDSEASNTREFTSSGTYSIRWLDNGHIQITQIQ